jgi:hypothetical protein
MAAGSRRHRAERWLMYGAMRRCDPHLNSISPDASALKGGTNGLEPEA